MPDVADVTGDLVDRGIGALSRAIDRCPPFFLKIW